MQGFGNIIQYLFFYRIERKGRNGRNEHSIYGGMKKAIKESVDNGRKINVDYFYRKLCTSENLNLIHDDCEHPGSYKGQNVDDNEMYMDEESENSNNFAELYRIIPDREMGGNNIEGSSGAGKNGVHQMCVQDQLESDESSEAGISHDPEEESPLISTVKLKVSASLLTSGKCSLNQVEEMVGKRKRKSQDESSDSSKEKKKKEKRN